MDKLVVIHNYLTWLHLTENWIYGQVRYLPDDVERHVVCKSTKNLDQFALPNIHSFAQASAGIRMCALAYGLLRLRRRFRRHSAFLLWVAKRTKATVMHSHFGYTGWRYMAAAERGGLKHIVTFYGVDVNYLPKRDPAWLTRYKEMFSSVERVLCEGPHMADAVAAMGCPKSKVKVHHLGVAVDKILFRPRQWSNNGPLRVLIAASFREKKGIPYAIEAIGRLQKTVPVEVTVLGDAGQNPESQAEKRKILATIDKWDLCSKVRLLGYQPFAVMLDEAYKHHIFLSPSVTAGDGNTEGGAPVSIIEMAASGMPVVSTRHCDIPEVIKDGVTGLLADERDVDGLVEHLQRLADQPQEWAPMVEAARRRVETEFNASIQGRRLAAIYEETAVS